MRSKRRVGATGVKTASANGVSGDEDEGNTHILELRPAAPILSIDRPAATVANDVMIAAVGSGPTPPPSSRPRDGPW